MKKIERILSIIIVLLHENIVSSQELADRFHVSKRTIYRDIETIEQTGLPIISSNGKYGGFALMPEYRMNSYTYTKEERALLSRVLRVSEELMVATTVSQELRYKVALLSQHYEEQQSVIQVEGATLHRERIERATKEKVYELEQAIANKNKVHIAYVTQGGVSSVRLIQPVQVLLENGSWYVRAYCEERAAMRLFKLTRIRQLTVTNKKYEQVFVEEGRVVPQRQTIQLTFQKSQLGKLYDFFVEEEININEQEIVVTFEEECTKNLLPFLLMFGSNVKVIAPERVKIYHQQKIQELSSLYDSNADS